MIRRYAAQFLYVSGVGFIRRQVVELENGGVIRISRFYANWKIPSG